MGLAAARKHRSADHGAPAHAPPSMEAFFDRQSILAHRPSHIPSLLFGNNPQVPAHDHQHPSQGISPSLPSPLFHPFLGRVDEQRPTHSVPPSPPGTSLDLRAPDQQHNASSTTLSLLFTAGFPAASFTRDPRDIDPRGKPTSLASVPQAAAAAWQTGHSLDTAMSGLLRAQMRSLLGEAGATRMAAASQSAAPNAAVPVRRAAASEGDVPVLRVGARTGKTASQSSSRHQSPAAVIHPARLAVPQVPAPQLPVAGSRKARCWPRSCTHGGPEGQHAGAPPQRQQRRTAHWAGAGGGERRQRG